MTSNTEAISLISDVKKNIESSSAVDLRTPQTEKRKNKTIIIDDYKKWNSFFSTNVTNTKRPNHLRHQVGGVYRYTVDDDNKYNGYYIKGEVFEQIKEEVCQKNNTIESIELKESKNVDDTVEPALRIISNDYSKEINLADLLTGDICKKHNVKAVTWCLPDGTRGIRLRIDKDGVKIYEAANGSYKLTLPWTAEGKECFITIHVYDDGRPVELVDHNDVTLTQLAKLDVKVGMQYDARPLREMLSSQLEQKSSEAVKILQAVPSTATPSTNMTDIAAAQKQGLQESEVCGARSK